VDVIPPNVAFGGLDKAIDAAKQGALARPAQAYYGQELAIGHFKGHLSQGNRTIIINFRQILDPKHSSPRSQENRIPE
jgi:hypothetical protein